VTFKNHFREPRKLVNGGQARPFRDQVNINRRRHDAPIDTGRLRKFGRTDAHRRLQRRDPQALAELYDRHGRAAYSLLPKRTRNESAPWMRWTPIASAGVVVLLGVIMTGVSLCWLPSGWLAG
jgi:hypothetical protein